MLAACAAGTTYGDVLLGRSTRAYADAGHPGAWREHYQGGPVGYRQREFEIVPTQTESRWFDTAIEVGHALAWNPSVAGGGKAEDTYLVGQPACGGSPTRAPGRSRTAAPPCSTSRREAARVKADAALARLQADAATAARVPRRRGLPRRDPERRRPARARGGRSAPRGRGHRRQPGLAGQRRDAAARVGAARDGRDRRRRGNRGLAVRRAARGLRHRRARALRGRLRALRPAARPARARLRGRGRRARGRVRDPQLPDRRPRPARAASRDAARGRAARRHRLEDLGDDGAVEPARAARARAARRDDGERPVGRHRRAARASCGPRRRCRSTSTSSRPTRSAASCAATSSAI